MKSPFNKITKEEWEKFLKQLKQKAIDMDKIDFNALGKDTDMDILYNFLKNEYGLDLRGVKVSIKEMRTEQEKYSSLISQEIEKQEKEAEQEFNKVLEKIEQDKTTKILEEVYYVPRQYAKMVANGNARGLIIFGEGGSGKTYSVMRAFREMSKPFVILAGHITGLELFHFLYENRENNIILDDINIMDSENNLNLLKSCLSDNSKIVQYHTTSDKLRCPKKFIFNGTITLILNDVPRENPSFKAVESRVLSYEMKFDYETKIKVLFELAKADYKELTKEERFDIAKWLKENTSIATKNLNLRVLFLLYEMYRFDKDNWVRLAEKIIINDERVKLVADLLKKHSTIKSAELEFIEITGYSRKTFYNIKKRIRCN